MYLTVYVYNFVTCVHDLLWLLRVGLQMECLTAWYQGSKIFLIARLLGRNTDVANCFVRIILLNLPVVVIVEMSII